MGAIIDPTGNGISQLQHTISKTKAFFSKFINASISQGTKWTAITSVIKPAILYPLVNIYYSEKEFQPLNSVTTQMKCIALGLNRHCPYAVLHGPLSLGGIGIPSSYQKTTLNRINYFLYNVHCESTIKWEFDISIIYRQMEVGTSRNFFLIPFDKYGHLPTPTYCVQLWHELEPYGAHLVPASNVTWCLTTISSNDLPLMEVAVHAYNRKGSKMINHCRMFLQLISILLYSKKTIHPAYKAGDVPLSHIPKISRPAIPRPPKYYWKLWSSFLYLHIELYLCSTPIQWIKTPSLHFFPTTTNIDTHIIFID